MKHIVMITFLLFASLSISAAYFQGEDETEISYSDSWKLGTPDNAVTTTVVVDPYNCECP